VGCYFIFVCGSALVWSAQQRNFEPATSTRPLLLFVSRGHPSQRKCKRTIDEPNEHALRADPFSITAAAAGQCRVLCWSDRHDTTLAELPTESMADISKLWQTEFRQLKANPAVKQALMFENKGVEIGVSNLHPHGQVYGLPFVSSHAQRMRLAQSRYANAPALVEDSSSDKSNDNPNGKDNPNDNPEDNRENSKNVKHSEDKHNHGRNHRKGNPHTRSLLIDMLNHASVKDTLIIERANYWTVLVPFAARFAYETWIVPHTHIPDLNALSDEILFELGEVYQRQAQRYDALFKRQSPNITHFHNAPCDNHPDNAHWCFHMAFQPPLREPDKLKYLGGFESAAGNITNPVQPEIAATRLRELGI